MGIGAGEVEVGLVSESVGQEVGTIRERFKIEELGLHEAMNGFDVALEGMSSGRNTGGEDGAGGGGATLRRGQEKQTAAHVACSVFDRAG